MRPNPFIEAWAVALGPDDADSSAETGEDTSPDLAAEFAEPAEWF